MFLLLKGEEFGQCPVCCISSEVKKLPSHCALESCSVTSWLCGTRQGNSFYSAESCDRWKAGPWWRSSVQSLFLPAACLLLDYLSHFYLSSRQATNKRQPWTPVPPLTAVALFWLFLVSVIVVPWSHKAPGTSENQALLMATQSLTLSQTHHLLLALEFTNGTLKMKRATEISTELQSMHWLGLIANTCFLLFVGRNWINPGSIWRGTEENQHWDGTHHRATGPVSGWTNNWPWCQHSQCSSYPFEEVSLFRALLQFCCQLISNKNECCYDWVATVLFF